MDRDYERYFEDRLNTITEQMSARFDTADAEPVRAAVSEGYRLAEADYGVRLRSDAALFLLISFQEFASNPVQSVRPDVSGDELAASIREDVRTIVRRAASEAVEGEISAHGIVNATSASWDELATAQWQLWDG
ncbi:MAG: hypothetical protein ACRDWT_12155 [Jatrophihabitantaceae bacterium]